MVSGPEHMIEARRRALGASVPVDALELIARLPMSGAVLPMRARRGGVRKGRDYGGVTLSPQTLKCVLLALASVHGRQAMLVQVGDRACCSRSCVACAARVLENRGLIRRDRNSGGRGVARKGSGPAKGNVWWVQWEAIRAQVERVRLREALGADGGGEDGTEAA